MSQDPKSTDDREDFQGRVEDVMRQLDRVWPAVSGLLGTLDGLRERIDALFGADGPASPSDRWANTRSFMCDTCMYFSGLKPGSPVGRCRRHAPSVSEGWPAVYPEDWCGDHKMGSPRSDRADV